MTADTVGGVWTYAVELAHALKPHGVEIALATMGAPLSTAQWAEAKALGNVTVYESCYKLEWMEDPWADVECAGDWLLELERNTNPDVIHLNGYVHGTLPWTAPTLVVGHSCVLSWWQAVKSKAAPASWSIYRDAVRAGLQSADAVAAPTTAMGHCLEAYYGPLLSGVEVISNCRNRAAFHRGVKEPFILSAGRLWDDAKNVAALARAAALLPWPVYVAGDDAAPGAAEAPTAREGVRTLGMLPPPEIADWMARASIYALPARYEPFGLSALEAALSGCALVLGDIPSLREVWGDAALYVAPDDCDGLTTTVLALIENEAERTKMAGAAWKRAKFYAPEYVADAYLAIYRRMLLRKEKAREYVA